MNICYTLEQLKVLLGDVESKGTSDSTLITGIASLEKAQRGDLSFLGNLKYRKQTQSSKASIILVPKSFECVPPSNCIFLYVDNPSLALTYICRDIEHKHRPKKTASIHTTAVIDPTARVHPSAYIGPFCYIGENTVVEANAYLQSHAYLGDRVHIGTDSFLGSKVTILDDCKIGNRVYIDTGVVIGSEGYGYESDKDTYIKRPHIGNVIIEDDVDIGANTTIDRARFAATCIGKHTKIDNLVQIGHNVIIGHHCGIVAQVGIAGSTVIGNYVMIWGQAGLAGHLNIEDGCVITGQCGVNHDLKSKSYVRGTPALPFSQANKIEIYARRLPEIYKRLCNIEDHVKLIVPYHNE